MVTMAQVTERDTLQALALQLIKQIVKNHGGTVDVDPNSNILNIDIPVENRVVCAQQIEEQVGKMCE